MGLLDDAIREHLELKRRRGADAGEITRQEREALGPARRGAEPATAEPEVERRPREDDEFAFDEDFAADAPSAVSELAPFDADAFQAPEPSRARSLPRDPEPPLSGGLPDEPAPPAAPEPPAGDPFTDDAWDDETAAIVEDAPRTRPQRSAAERLAELDEYDARGAVAPPARPPEPPPPAPREDVEQATTQFSAHDVEEATRHPPPPLGDDEPDIVPADDGGEDLLEETPDFLEETPEHDRLWFEQRPPRDFDFDG